MLQFTSLCIFLPPSLNESSFLFPLSNLIIPSYTNQLFIYSQIYSLYHHQLFNQSINQFINSSITHFSKLSINLTPTIQQSVHLSIYLSIYLSPSLHLFIYLSIHQIIATAYSINHYHITWSRCMWRHVTWCTEGGATERAGGLTVSSIISHQHDACTAARVLAVCG